MQASMNYPQLFALQPLIYGGLAESWRLYFLNDYTVKTDLKKGMVLCLSPIGT